jgi:hypothetical protein
MPEGPKWHPDEATRRQLVDCGAEFQRALVDGTPLSDRALEMVHELGCPDGDVAIYWCMWALALLTRNRPHRLALVLQLAEDDQAQQGGLRLLLGGAEGAE